MDCHEGRARLPAVANGSLSRCAYILPIAEDAGAKRLLWFGLVWANPMNGIVTDGD